MPDFLPERDAILLTFSRNFAQKLSAAPGDFGVTPLDAAQYQALADAYALAYRTAYEAATNSTTAVAAKREARKLLKQDTRRLARIVRAAGVTNAQLIQLGLRAPGPRRKRIARPTSAPEVMIRAVNGRRVHIRLENDEEGSRRARPRGVIGAIVYTFVGNAAPDRISDYRVARLASRTSATVSFGADVPPGSMIWITASWRSPRLQAGPLCMPKCTHIAGGFAEESASLRLAA